MFFIKNQRLYLFAIILILHLIAPNILWAMECRLYFKTQDLKAQISNTENPLLKTSSLESGHYPEFNKIQPGHFLEAIEAALQKATQKIQKLETLKTPDFSFILEIESLDKEIETVDGILSFYTNSFKTSDYQDLELIIDEQTVSFYADFSTNPKIFAHIKTIYENQAIRKHLSPEELLLLDGLYQTFARSGALLNGKEKVQYKALVTEISNLQSQFSNNLSNYKKNTFVHVTSETELDGIPEDVVSSMKASAKARGLEGAVIELSQPGITVQVMERASSDALKKELFLKIGKSGYSQENNNEIVLRKIVSLRQEIAALLGYKNYAEYVLQNQMAQTTEKVYEFLNDLYLAYKDKGEQEKLAIETFKKTVTGSHQIDPWNRIYWMNQYETSQLKIDTQEFKKYLEFNQVRQGFFDLARSLYGITFRLRPDLPRISPDIDVYQVLSSTGETYGYLSMDVFSRNIKKPGAWMSQHRSSYVKGNEHIPALISINLNTTKPENGEPLLLTLLEGETFYHEMGHALHGLLSRTTFASQAGTRVKRDFVELPSQIMENFFTDPDHMRTFAFDYKTGKPIPTEYLEKLIHQKQLFSGTATLRQISFAQLDMAWYTGFASTLSGSLIQVENTIMNPYLAFKNSNETVMSTAFSHIFSGGYSSGYYSYKWAEVLDADAYFILKKEGAPAALRFLKYILEKGGSVDPNTAYENFAGRPASIDALLERDGIKKDQ